MKKFLKGNRFWWAKISVDSLCNHWPTHTLVYHFILEKWYSTLLSSVTLFLKWAVTTAFQKRAMELV